MLATLLFFFLVVVVSGGSFGGDNNNLADIRVSSSGSNSPTFLCNPRSYPHINNPSTDVQDTLDNSYISTNDKDKLASSSSSKSIRKAYSNLLLSIRGGGDDGQNNNIQTITSLSQIQKTIISTSDEHLVVLDFTSNNCPPCEMIAPIYKDLSELEEFQQSVIFCKVNVTNYPNVAEEYNVDGWPTFLLFKNGRVVDSIVGGQAAKAGLYSLIAKYQ